MQNVVLFGIFLILMLIGIPIGTAVGISAMVTLFTFQLGAGSIGPNFVAGMSSFPLLAIPFFVLAGVIMQRCGIAARIARLFELLVGRRTGGLAMVAVLTCMFWGALSGSGPATTAAVGMILVGPMIRHGYDKRFAAATIANAADLSIIIPPSIAFIIYGTITRTSVSALFIAGIVPGILMGIGALLVAWLVSRMCGYRGKEAPGSAADILKALRQAAWAILSPIIILGGIYSGVFTPTEAAVVAVFYSLFVAVVIYRSINMRDLLDILVEATTTTSVIMFIVVFAGIFSWTVATTGISDAIAATIVSVSPNALVMILLVNVLLLVMGMFLDAISISYLVLPILIPVLAQFGVNMIWYGVVFITALAIGQITPPVGVNLFTAANLVDDNVDAISRKIIPYAFMNVVVLIVLSLFPLLSLFLPRLMGAWQP